MSRRLPDAWVQKIFATMQGNYGTRFLNMWRTGQVLQDGNDAGVVNAMSTWAEKLGGFADRPDVFKRVLDNLPPEPPSLPQFLELMRTAWKPLPSQTLEHKLTAEEIEANKLKAAENIVRLRAVLKGL
jgi:hypothetical protein